MLKVFLLFFISIILTAIFSYSLKTFLSLDYVALTIKTIIVPCFTWTILLLTAYKKLDGKEFLNYSLIAGVVCAIGSALLVPVGIYNFIEVKPNVNYSIASVLISVCCMSFLFFVLLRRNNFSLQWWWAYNILICTNMTIFYFVAIK